MKGKLSLMWRVVIAMVMVLSVGLVMATPAFAQAIGLTPSSGPPGTVTTVAGSGFTGSASGWVWFDSNGNSSLDSGEPYQAVTADGAGAFSTTLTIPSVAAGTYKIRADVPAGLPIEAWADFIVTTPTLTLTPNIGPAGSSVAIAGSNFLPSTAYRVYFDSDGDDALTPGEPYQAVTSDGTGAFSTSLTVPSVAAGSYFFRADDSPYTAPSIASAVFTVTTTSITLNPSFGEPTTPVTVTGSGFAASAVGQVWFDINGNGVLDGAEVPVAVTTTATGEIPAGITVTVPSVPGGDYPVQADIPTGGVVEASATFSVVASIGWSPNVGGPGTVITFSGRGFAGSASGLVWFDSNGNGSLDSGEPFVTVSTAANGDLPATTLSVPSVPAGNYTIPVDVPSGLPVETFMSFTVPPRGITLTPASGVPGSTVTVSGAGFAASAVGQVWFDINGNGVLDGAEVPVAVTTTATGEIPAGITVTVPSVPAGDYPVQADIPTGGVVEASATFTVPATGITLTPNTAPVSTVVTVAGAGFTPGAYRVYFDSDSNDAYDVGEPFSDVTADAFGAFSTTLTIPSVAAGSYFIRADTAPYTAPSVASAPFTVTIPSITLTPDSGPPGTSVAIAGSGFLPGASGRVWFDSDGDGAWSPGEPQVTLTVGSAGTFTVSLTVPSVAVGTYGIEADAPPGPPIEAAVTFTVTEPLPSWVTTIINKIDAIEAKLDEHGNFYTFVDTWFTTIEGYVSGLETKINAIAAKIDLLPTLDSNAGSQTLAARGSVTIVASGTTPLLGTLSIQSTGTGYDVDVYTGTDWITIVESGARNASYPVSGFGLRIVNDTTASRTVTYVVVYHKGP